MHSGILASAVLSISLLSGGVASAGQVIDHAMGTTEVPDAPLRVITLTNETTEAALALGVTPVGAPKSWYGDPWYPHLGDRLEGAEVLGTELAVNVELVAALEPDLIIGSRKRDEEIYGQLSAIAPTVFIEGLGAWKGNFAFVADVLNREAEGEGALASYETRVEALKDGLGDNAGESISVVRFVPGQTYLYLKGSFLGHVLADVGFSRPPQQDADGLSLAVGRESIPDMDGDRIFWLTYDTGDGKGDAMAEEFLSDPLWSRLSAVKDGRVHEVDDGVWATAGGWFAAQEMLSDLAEVYGVELPPAEAASD